MKKTHMLHIYFLLLTLIILSLACQMLTPDQEPVATATVDLTQTAVANDRATQWVQGYFGTDPTSTPKPKPTSKPSATPDVAATQTKQTLMTTIQEFVDSGYIDSAEGELIPLQNHSEEMAKINYLGFSEAGYDGAVENFVFFGDVAWASAGPVNYPEYSGCGFAYRVKDGVGFYTALLTNDSVYMSYCNENTKKCGRIGTTRGSGKLDFDNPASASMILIVSEDRAYVTVDGNFIGEYSLFKDTLREPGYVMYGMISGTNRDYGTRCEITNPTLWVVNP